MVFKFQVPRTPAQVTPDQRENSSSEDLSALSTPTNNTHELLSELRFPEQASDVRQNEIASISRELLEITAAQCEQITADLIHYVLGAEAGSDINLESGPVKSALNALRSTQESLENGFHASAAVFLAVLENHVTYIVSDVACRDSIIYQCETLKDNISVLAKLLSANSDDVNLSTSLKAI